MAHLFVIAGHGAGDPGACASGFSEAERVRALAKRIKALGGNQVTLGDFNRDYYADNGISSLDIPADWEITELHMDSAAEGAKGGHVIIKAGFTPDQYDNALASFIGGILPGRSNLIVGRDDLANPDRAAARGYSYRLVEVGFITNKGDLAIFNDQMDDIARGILEAFEIKTDKPVEKPDKVNASLQANNGADCTRLSIKAVKDGICKVIDKEHGFMLTAAAGQANANVDFREFDCGDYQLWRLVKKRYKNADYTMLESVATPGLYLSAENNGSGGKNNLKLYTDLHNMKQKFYIREETDGRSLIIHSFSGKCVAAK